MTRNLLLGGWRSLGDINHSDKGIVVVGLVDLGLVRRYYENVTILNLGLRRLFKWLFLLSPLFWVPLLALPGVLG